MIVFDIETVKDDMEAGQLAWFSRKLIDKRLKDPEKIDAAMAEASDKFGLSPLTGKIILIGILSDAKLPGLEPLGGMYLGQLGLNGTPENENISAFWNLMSLGLSQGQRLVSYNGKKFDLPFLFGRSLFHGLPKPQALRTIDDFISKYKSTFHLDIFNTLGEYGTQSEWANRLNISPTLASDGKNIQEWYNTGKFDEIKEKNKLDLTELASIARLVEPWV